MINGPCEFRYIAGLCIYSVGCPSCIVAAIYLCITVLLYTTMLFRQLCAILAAAALSDAAPAPVKHVLHERREESSMLDWVKGDRVENNAILPVRIGLTQNNLEQGYDYLMDVYASKN